MPNLISTVAVDLTEEFFVDNIDRPSSTSSTSSKRKCEKGSKIVDILHDIQSGCRQAELSKRKLELTEQMELLKAKEDHWKEEEEVHKEREEEHRTREHLFETQWKAKEDAHKENEEERKAHEHLFNKWEHIQLSIRQLSSALSNETMNLSNMICSLIKSFLQMS